MQIEAIVISLSNYIGQEAIVAELRRLNEIPHMVFCGPEGSGKRTLAKALANETGAIMLHLSASSIERLGDLISPLLLIREGNIFMISEIEALPKGVFLALLKQAMGFQIKIKKESCDPINLNLPRFTLILTGTKIPEEFQDTKSYDFYALKKDQLAHILVNKCGEEGVEITPETIEDICSRASTPRDIFKEYREYKDLSICAPEPTFA